MYIEVKENKLTSWCEHPYLNYEYVDIEYSSFEPEKYKVVEGKLVDISESEEYLERTNKKVVEINNKDLKRQIDELDKKRIRALCEPALKDEIEGVTWIEYYTSKIQELRKLIVE